MPTTAEPIFDGAEKKMSPSNEAVKINYIGDSGARVRLLAVRSTARGEEGEKRHQKHNQIRGDQRLGQILRREIRGDGALHGVVFRERKTKLLTVSPFFLPGKRYAP